MSAILDTIIARGFNLNQPEFGRNMIEAQNRRQIIDSNLQTDETYRRDSDFRLQQIMNQVAQQERAGQSLSELVALEAQMPEVMAAQQKVLANTNNFENIRPELRPQAEQMLMKPVNERAAKAQALKAEYLRNSPAAQDMVGAQMFAPELSEPSYRPLSQQEAASIPGLDPSKAYQIAPDGKITTIGGNSGVNVTVNGPEPSIEEKAEDKERGKLFVKELADVQETESGALQTLQQLEIMRGIPVETGAAEGLKAGIGNLAAGLGIELPPDAMAQVVNAQSFNSVAGTLLAAKLSAQKGVQTESDAARMRQTLAQLTNVPASNDFIVRSSIAVESRKVQMAEFARQWEAQRGSLRGWKQGWNAYINDTPLLGTNEKTGLPVFYTEFVEQVSKANPNMNREQIEQMWRDKYGD